MHCMPLTTTACAFIGCFVLRNVTVIKANIKKRFRHCKALASVISFCILVVSMNLSWCHTFALQLFKLKRVTVILVLFPITFIILGN